jgi:serine phosphatase RsbU (regulator of sigma subunit)
MAEDTGGRSRMTRTRKRSPAAIALLCCCALAMLGISSAAAHPGHGKPASSGPPSSTPAAGPAGPGNAASHAAPAASPPASAGPSAPPAAEAASKRHGHSGATPAAARSVGAGRGNGHGVGDGAGAAKGGGGKAKAATLSTPKVEVPTLPSVSVPNLPTSQPAPVSTPSPAPATTPAEAAAAPTATQPTASTPAASQPARKTDPVTPQRHARRSARHTRAQPAHRRSRRASAGAGAGAHHSGAKSERASSSTLALARRGRHAHKPRAARHPQAASQLEPIVKTITKIVGVVPLAVRLLIGLLLALALALAVRSRLAALHGRRLERQRAQLLQDVGLLQAALLPVSPARIGPVGTSVAYRPADGPAAGGDFYDVFALENGLLGVVVGDVSGHGRQALPHTALLRFTLRAYLEAGLSPREVLRTAGTVLERQLGASFATVVVATYHPRERVLTYACAGHPHPIVTGSGVALAPVTVCASPPIGTGMPTGTRQTVVSLPGAARVCFHTDGLTEARTGSDLYGAERLTRTVQALEPGSGASRLLERVTEQTDARPDDMAACLLTIDGPHAPPRVLVEQLQLSREDADIKRMERFLEACGADATQAARLIGTARVAGERGDALLLEVRSDGGSAQATLRSDNVASLGAQPARPAVLGAVQ